MKTRLIGFSAVAFACLLVTPWTHAAIHRPSNGAPTLYVTVDSFDPVAFDRHRNSRETGEELILSTLKNSAAAQARFAHLQIPVVVLDQDTRPPAGSLELRLTWNRDVTATLVNGPEGKPDYLGVVSHTPLAFHPDHEALIAGIRAQTMPDPHRDAVLRANVQMDLYVALERVQHELAGGKG